MENKFKVGDRVRITKPKNWGKSPFWATEMDYMDGELYEVSGRTSYGNLKVRGDSHAVHPDWCELVEAAESVEKPEPSNPEKKSEKESEKESELVFPWKVDDNLKVVELVNWASWTCDNCPMGCVRKGDVITITKIGCVNGTCIPFSGTVKGREYGFSYSELNKYELVETEDGKATEKLPSDRESTKLCNFKLGDIIVVNRQELEKCISAGKFHFEGPIEKIFTGRHEVKYLIQDFVYIEFFDEYGAKYACNIPITCCDHVQSDAKNVLEEDEQIKETKGEGEVVIPSTHAKMKIYIAGKITGLPEVIANSYFNAAKRTIEKWGFEAVSPLDYGDESKSWVENMLILLPILNTCDGIYLLDNWESSDGAKIEKKFAEKKGMFVIKEVI